MDNIQSFEPERSSLKRDKVVQRHTADKLAPVPEGIKKVPYDSGGNAALFPFNNSVPRAFDQYRIIRTKIFQNILAPRQIAISSAAPKDGKTITSVNIAGVMALTENIRVLLVEADLHRGDIKGLLGLRAQLGLADVLTGRCTLGESMVQLEQMPNLFVLPGGELDHGATELLDSTLWKTLCSSWRNQFSYVIVDCPPWGILADADLITATSDAVVFVVRPDRTKRSMALKALGDIPKDKLLGVVVNSSKDWILHRTGYSYYGGYYGGYYYGYRKDSKEGSAKDRKS